MNILVSLESPKVYSVMLLANTHKINVYIPNIPRNFPIIEVG